MTTTKPMTADEFARIQDDGRMTADELLQMEKGECRYELVSGELVEMAPTDGEHSLIRMGIGARLWNHVRSNNLGNVYGSDAGFIFARSPDTVLSPDASFVRMERLPRAGDHESFLPVVPDLAVEVISPSDRITAVTEKALYYIESGVKLVWVVNPRDRTVTVYTPDSPPRLVSDVDELDGGEVLPDFQLPVSAIFE